MDKQLDEKHLEEIGRRAKQLSAIRDERINLHDRIDELAAEIRADEASYQQRQAARQSEINQAAARIGEIKSECAMLESFESYVSSQKQAVPA